MAMQIGTFYNKGAHFEGVIETRKLSDLGTVVIADKDATNIFTALDRDIIDIERLTE